jgi:hypothetical protein
MHIIVIIFHINECDPVNYCTLLYFLCTDTFSSYLRADREVRHFHFGVAEDLSFLGCDTVSLGPCLIVEGKGTVILQHVRNH